MITLSDNFWKRLSMISALFMLLCTFGLLVFTSNLEIKDLDLWLHIGMGRYIVEHNFHVPAVDILSFTVTGTPWVNHEWLFQVIVYFIHSHWGFEGLIDMQIWLVALTMLMLVFLGYSRKNQFLTLLALFLVSLVYQSRFTIRPDLFSLSFFTIYIVILAFFIHRKWSIWALFFVQILWTNMHGFFFLGPLMVGLSLFGEWIKRIAPLPWDWNKVGRLTDKEYYQMKLLLGVVILACFFNPMGVHGVIYPLKVFTQISGESKVFFTKIVELQKPITKDTIFSITTWPYYKLLIIISFLSFVFNRRKIDIGILIFWLFFLFFSLIAIRNLVFFAFAAYLAIVANLITIRFKDFVPIRFTSKKFLYITAVFANILLICWAMRYYVGISNNGYFDFDKYERKSEFGGISQRQFPNKAVDFLVKNKVRGNFFNDFNSGAYLIGRTYPAIKVFIDGRTEVYGPAFFQYYRDILEFDNVEKLKAALTRFQITGVLLNSVQNPLPDNLLNYLYKSKEWVVVYFDYDGMIFLKETPINREIISRNRIDLENWKAKELDLYRLGAREISPYQNLNRSFTLASLGLDDAAKAESLAALKVNPSFSGPYKILGKIAAKKKDFQGAYEAFRIATTLSFYDQVARMNMSLALADMGRFDDAAIQYQKVIDLWPTYSKGYLRLAKTHIARKKYALVFENLKKGYDLDFKASEDVLLMGDMLVDGKVYDLAEKVFDLVIAKEPTLVKAYLKISSVYERTARRDKAITLLKHGLQKNPESKELKEKLRSLGARPEAKK
ncbi:MAG: tetratricopeptide repeat protein [Candidatus Omnitrophica bacterium]|nr:tetratricopeptide repeat protein [Candidatus Omnitrophota bacterium]